MTPQEGTIKIRVRVDKLNQFMTLAGIRTNAALAQRMGTVSEATISRVRSKGHRPNEQVIAGLLRAFEGVVHFDDLFEVTGSGDEQTAGAA